MIGIRSLAVSTAMLIIAVFGVMAISTYASIAIIGDIKHRNSLQNDALLTDLAVSVGGLTHELQKERGASAGFIASKGQNFVEALPKQRELSNEHITMFRNTISKVQAHIDLDPNLEILLVGVLAQIDALPELRGRVDALDIPLLEAVGAITELNRSAIGLLPEMGKGISYSNAANAVQRHAIFMTAKDLAGLVRATGATGFTLAAQGEGMFPPKVRARFDALLAEQGTLISIYQRLASDQMLTALNGLAQAQPTKDVQRLVDIVRTGDPAKVTAVAPQDFFATITGMINIIKSIEDQGAAEISGFMDTALSDAQSALMRSIMHVTVIMLVFLMLSGSFAAGAMRSMRATSNRVAALAEGDLDSEVIAAPQADLKKITDALTKFRDNAIEQRGQADVQHKLEASSAEGIKQISLAVSKGEFGNRLRLRNLSGAALILGNGINEILETAENFMKEQSEKDAAVLRQQRQESEAQMQATQELNGVVKACSLGDFSRKMVSADKQGAWIDVANGINRISNTTDAALADIARLMRAISNGNLEERIEAEYSGTFAEIGEATNKSLDQLHEAFLKISASVQSIGDAATQLKKGTGDLAERSDDQARIVEESQAATGELSQTIGSNRQSLEECRGLMQSLEQQTEKSRAVAKSAIGSMSAIETASSEMNKIVATIEEIAFQTNLLALNASVEAARAGEAGKGFSVVAAEVRSLATRCSDASNQISQLISHSVEEVSRGSENVQQTGHAITEMQSLLEDVLRRIDYVAVASEEQMKGVQSLDDSIQKMDTASQSNRTLALENNKLMETLLQLETRLTSAVSGFLQGKPDVQSEDTKTAA